MKAVIQIRAETAFPDQLFQGLICRGNDTHVNRHLGV